jgi:DNA-binding CsgD family transcriptional regulator
MREIAIALGLGVGTVRHHLKRIFHKTGANGQAKLVALLRNFIDPLR